MRKAMNVTHMSSIYRWHHLNLTRVPSASIWIVKEV